MKPYKIGIDYHGVITHRPQLWKFLLNGVLMQGGEVHIITGGTLERGANTNPIIDKLKEWDIPYTDIHSVYDYLIKTNAPTIEGVRYFPDGTTQKKYADPVWDKVKGYMATQLGLDIHIDDTEVYGDYFTDVPFMLYKK
jgi:hypothetical protein